MQKFLIGMLVVKANILKLIVCTGHLILPESQNVSFKIKEYFWTQENT